MGNEKIKENNNNNIRKEIVGLVKEMVRKLERVKIERGKWNG